MSQLIREFTATETLHGIYVKSGDTLYFITAERDDDAENPHEDHGTVEIITTHNRVFTGDVVCSDPDEYITQRIADNIDFLIRPLYLLDHSGISICTKPFSDHWDSGLVGYVLCTKQNVIDHFGTEENWKQNAVKIIESEIEEYDNYLSGNVYNMVLYEYDPETNRWDIAETCGEFYTDDEEYMALEMFDMTKAVILSEDEARKLVNA